MTIIIYFIKYFRLQISKQLQVYDVKYLSNVEKVSGNKVLTRETHCYYSHKFRHIHTIFPKHKTTCVMIFQTIAALD